MRAVVEKVGVCFDSVLTAKGAHLGAIPVEIEYRRAKSRSCGLMSTNPASIRSAIKFCQSNVVTIYGEVVSKLVPGDEDQVSKQPT